MTWFAGVYPCVSPEDPEGQKCYFSISISNKYTIYKKFSGSSGTSREYTHSNQSTAEDPLTKVFRFPPSSSGFSGTRVANIAHLDSTILPQKFLFSSKYFSQAIKYQKNMAPKKPKIKKSIKKRVKKKLIEPAKGVIERTIRKYPMLKQVQKEMFELKKKVKKYKK